MKEKRILITGAKGFIGKNLSEFLSDKYKVFATSHQDLNILDFQAVKSFFDKNKIDFVIHCASKGGARGIEDDPSVIDDNLQMFHNLESCLNGSRMITFGSGAQFDKSRPLIKIKEEELGKFIPKDPYGYSKLFTAKEIEKLNNVLCLNIFGCYGKGEKENRFPTDAILKNLKKEPIFINKNVIFDYLYINDLCKIVEFFIENNPKEKIINVTPTQSISLLKIAQIINKTGDFKSEIIIKEQGLNNQYTGDNQKLLKEMNGYNFTSYEDGLKELYQHLIKNEKVLRHCETRVSG